MVVNRASLLLSRRIQELKEGITKVWDKCSPRLGLDQSQSITVPWHSRIGRLAEVSSSYANIAFGRFAVQGTPCPLA